MTMDKCSLNVKWLLIHSIDGTNHHACLLQRVIRSSEILPVNAVVSHLIRIYSLQVVSIQIAEK